MVNLIQFICLLHPSFSSRMVWDHSSSGTLKNPRKKIIVSGNRHFNLKYISEDTWGQFTFLWPRILAIWGEKYNLVKSGRKRNNSNLDIKEDIITFKKYLVTQEDLNFRIIFICVCIKRYPCKMHFLSFGLLPYLVI